MNSPPWEIIPGVTTLPKVVTPNYFIHNKIVLFLFHLIKKFISSDVNADCNLCVGRKKDITLHHEGKKYDLAFKYKGNWFVFIEIKTKHEKEL
jgi:hypothetical protein